MLSWLWLGAQGLFWFSLWVIAITGIVTVVGTIPALLLLIFLISSREGSTDA